MKPSMLSVLAISLFTILHVDQAAAQQRTWVSGTGNDGNPCSRMQPCQTFAGAFGKTATGGEINCLDSGGFGTVVIDRSISIRCVGVTAGVLTALIPASGIVVVAPGGSEVLLEGLDIDGQGTGLNGVEIGHATKVTIQNCSIRNFTGNGVSLAGPLGARVLIADSTILSNNVGLYIAGTGASNTAVVMRTIIDNHPVASVVVASGNNLIMSASKLTGSPSSVSVAGGATFTSFGDNAIQSAGNPSFTIPLR